MKIIKDVYLMKANAQRIIILALMLPKINAIIIFFLIPQKNANGIRLILYVMRLIKNVMIILIRILLVNIVEIIKHLIVLRKSVSKNKLEAVKNDIKLANYMILMKTEKIKKIANR